MLNHTTEIWKDIKDFEGHYQVSSLGRIRSIRTSQATYRERIKKTSISNAGYEQVNLFKNNESFTKMVHRLVAESFITNPLNKKTVNHINGIKTDNASTNLEWNTHSENLIHASNTGLIDKIKCRDRMIGTKYNSKSKYHNVSYDSNRQKWIGSIKVNKKTIGQKRFDTEEEAALYINHLIDLHGLNRPKNVVV